MSLQRKATNQSEIREVPPIVRETLNSPGRPLDDSTRSFFEARLDHDFSNVRVHTDQRAGESADTVDAHAYTVGENVVFGEGRYAPETTDGKKLLAHELTHVVQQAGTVQPSLVSGGASDPYEQEADRRTEGLVEPHGRVTPEGVPPVAQTSANAGHVIQRQPKTKEDEKKPKEGVQKNPEVDQKDTDVGLKDRKIDEKGKEGELEKRVGQLEKGQKREQRKSNANLQFQLFQHQVNQRALGWLRAAERIGAAYAEAARRHKEALESRAKSEALQTQMMFSILTVATSGALSWISGAWQAAKEVQLLQEALQLGAGAVPKSGASNLIKEALEDASQAAVGEALSAMGPTLKTSSNDPQNMEPMVFRQAAIDRVLGTMQVAEGYFADISAQMLYAPDKVWDTFSEKEQGAKYTEWAKKADLLGGDANLPSREAMADELERGMWSQWASLHLSETRLPMHKEATQEVTYYKSPGTAVEKAFDRLGITAAAGVGEFWWFWTTESDIKKIIQWGKSYKVKKFV